MQRSLHFKPLFYNTTFLVPMDESRASGSYENIVSSLFMCPAAVKSNFCVCVQELTRERQENMRLLKGHQDKDDLIGKLKEEIDLLNRVSPALSTEYTRLSKAEQPRELCVF